MTAEASHTLYLRGLDQKMHPDRLRMLLYASFSRFGEILDIVCTRRFKLRGQAWIVFREVPHAAEALKRMEGVTMFGKPVEIDFSHNKSDAIARLQGTYVPRKKRKDDSSAAGMNGTKQVAGKSEDDQGVSKKKKRPAPSDEMPSKEQKTDGIVQPKPINTDAPPHNVIFVQNLPPETTQFALETLFKIYPGFMAVRYVAARNMAFIDFDTVQDAVTARAGADGFKLTATHVVQASFAKQ